MSGEPNLHSIATAPPPTPPTALLSWRLGGPPIAPPPAPLQAASGGRRHRRRPSAEPKPALLTTPSPSFFPLPSFPRPPNLDVVAHHRPPGLDPASSSPDPGSLWPNLAVPSWGRHPPVWPALLLVVGGCGWPWGAAGLLCSPAVGAQLCRRSPRWWPRVLGRAASPAVGARSGRRSPLGCVAVLPRLPVVGAWSWLLRSSCGGSGGGLAHRLRAWVLLAAVLRWVPAGGLATTFLGLWIQ